MAVNLTAWSDEITQMSIGKGLQETGKLLVYSFDTGKMTSAIYKRAAFISYLIKLTYQYSGFSLLSSRIIPLIFTLLTFIVYVFYMRINKDASSKNILLAAILFFGQSMVLEKALYVRMYAPLAFMQLISMITYWEGLKDFNNKKLPRSIILWGICAFAVLLPLLDWWHYQQIPILLLGILINVIACNESYIKYLKNNKIKVYSIIITLIILAPIIVILNNSILSVMPCGNKIIRSTYSTYWDNIAGLVRYGWALNICFIGIFVLLFGKRRIDWDFNSWLFVSGILSGLFTGLYNPHNYIFWSRYFYVPVVLTVLGFSGMLSKLVENKSRRNLLIVVYLLMNIALSFTTFYYDRSNIRKPITWLNSNLGKRDVLLAFSAELELHGGEKLTKYAYLIRPSQDPEDIRKLIKIIDRPNVKDIYFLYTAHHEALRGKLYYFTTFGGDRTPPADLFRYLRSQVPGVQVMEGLRGCGLKKYNKRTMVRELNLLLKKGYPQPFISIERRIVKRVKGIFYQRK
jgi:hypothetical protein